MIFYAINCTSDEKLNDIESLRRKEYMKRKTKEKKRHSKCLESFLWYKTCFTIAEKN
jgi:hypothetical protein